jgi:hypothetical protein
MKRLLATAVLVLGLFGSVVGSLRAEVTAEQVRLAIERGISYLKMQQQIDGGWPREAEVPGQPEGVSALCTLALLNSGVEPSDEKMQKALNHLRLVGPMTTYVVSLQTMVFARAEPEKDRPLIERNVRWLERTQLAIGPRKGAWSYSEPGGFGDNSNSQFALLALYEAERAGVSASDRTWLLAKNYWEKGQKMDGSWDYNGNPTEAAPSGSMTCAGITSLVIAADRVQASNARVTGDRIECCLANDNSDSDRIEKGLQWLGLHYSVTRNPGTNPPRYLLYYLYGLERVGRMTARRFLPLAARAGQPDKADWYREGAEHLVRTQDSLSGFWTGVGHAENTPLIGTSFSLLFLSKGRWPVLFGKVQHAPGNDWNRHRSDTANLTRYVESRWKRDLTWQVVNLRLATVEEMLQTPVLYMCGDQSPLPEEPARRKELAKKIRDYLDRGGFLFAEAYCDGAGFDGGFRELMRQVFPEPEYKLQLLAPEHPIWYAEEKVDPQQLRQLWGIEFGCRTSVVYVPVEQPKPSLSCLWELGRPGRGEKFTPAVQAQIDAGMSLGLNVAAYATNRELKSKENFFTPSGKRRPGDQTSRGRLYVATLRHPGGCNTAPRALANLMDAAEHELKGELKVRPEVRGDLLDITDEALFDYHLVFMNGRTAFHLTAAEQHCLKQFVERGGMIFADSICANQAFTESFRREMAAIFPDRKLEPIPADDGLLTTRYGGFDLQTVSRRDPSTGGPAGAPLEATVRKVPPELEGVKFDDRWGVVFSPYDVSCALEKHDSLECRGYVREDAARIGLNVVLYSVQQ